MKISRDDRAVKLSCSDWCGLHHSTHRKGHQSKLLLFTRRAVDVISEACFTGDLWASHFGPQLDRSRSDTVMISMNYNCSATLVIFFYHSCFVLLCSWTRTLNTIRVSCVLFLLPCVSLQSNWAWSADCPFRFLFEDFRLCSRYNNVNYGAWHVYKPLFGCSAATEIGKKQRGYNFIPVQASFVITH